MTTTLFPPVFTNPLPGSTLLASAIGAVLAPLTGGRRTRDVLREVPKPLLVEARPSILDPFQTGWVCDALGLLSRLHVSWQTAARFLGYLEAYYAVGCDMRTTEVVAQAWQDHATGLIVCGGKFEKYLPAGAKLLKQFAGYEPAANVEPVFLWLGVREMLTAPPKPAPAAN